MSACGIVHMNADTLRGHRYWVPLVLELQAVEPPDMDSSNWTWVLQQRSFCILCTKIKDMQNHIKNKKTSNKNLTLAYT